MKRKIFDIISLSLVCVVVGGIAVANLVQTDRPTVSATENRTLAEMPAFTVEGLADGSYFKGISAFVSDTFLARDRLVALSKKMDTLKGIDYKLDGKDSFVMLPGGSTGAETADPDMEDLLNQAFENLGKTETDAPETSAPETDAPETSAPETDAPETSAPETDAPETSAPETDVPETSAPETDAPETSVPETDAPETDAPETDAPETDEPETDEPETDASETEYEVRGLTLSKESLKLTVGSGAVVYAYLDTDNPVPGNVKWSVSDSKVVSISINPNGGIDVKALAAGTCTLRCRYENQFRVTCEITVTEITQVTQTQNNTAADFVTSDMFIYGDAVYTSAFYSAANAGNYLRTAAYYKSLFGEDVGVNVLVAPVSSVVIDNETVKATIGNQEEILDNMAGLADSSINFVDVYDAIYEHRDEYLYFKTDHHWTQRGAYYAYTAFAESVGLTPTPLEDFDFTLRNDDYHGSMYMYTQDERVKQFKDEVEVFVSRKAHTMTVTASNGATYTYDSAVANGNTTYVTFIAGDNPYTVINVPENPQDYNILVLKDSFGNALVPFLCEHYGNIIVVDVRYSSFNIYEQLKDYGISDILFINNIQAANSSAWSKMYLSAVGIG